MPDLDGIEGPYPDGRAGCAYCGAASLAWPREIEEHRRKCGPKWREQYGRRRGKSEEELRIESALEVPA